MTIRSALETALAQAKTTDADSAVIALARLYADEIDDNSGDSGLEKLGPKLLAALVELRLTPKSRNAVVNGETVDPGNPLDELRARREQRAVGQD